MENANDQNEGGGNQEVKRTECLVEDGKLKFHDTFQVGICYLDLVSTL